MKRESHSLVEDSPWTFPKMDVLQITIRADISNKEWCVSANHFGVPTYEHYSENHIHRQVRYSWRGLHLSGSGEEKFHNDIEWIIHSSPCLRGQPAMHLHPNWNYPQWYGEPRVVRSRSLCIIDTLKESWFLHICIRGNWCRTWMWCPHWHLYCL